MAEASLLASWESFYVIVGSSAAALTGLQFVVVTLSAETNIEGAGATARAFSTPTIVHFSSVLLVSALLSAPWPRIDTAGIVLSICGLLGVVYALVVIRHARRQQFYKPVLEDWIFHCGLPLVAYGALAVTSFGLAQHPVPSLFAIAGVALLLLFIGIHNAWDSVNYIAYNRKSLAKRSNESS